MSAPGARRASPPPLPDMAGIRDHLIGVRLPALTLESTSGSLDLAELSADLLVLFVYPHATGLPDGPVAGWELIPGALGCTAQACGFRDQYERLSELGATVAGLSVQSVAEQRQFAARTGVTYPLLSDADFRLARLLGLPTFTAGGRTFYRRLTLVARAQSVIQVFYPVFEPERNAVDVVAWLEADRRGDGR